MTLIERLRQLADDWTPKHDNWSPYGPNMGRKLCAAELNGLLDDYEAEVQRTAET